MQIGYNSSEYLMSTYGNKICPQMNVKAHHVPKCYMCDKLGIKFRN